jgi:hypothetical protein
MAWGLPDKDEDMKRLELEASFLNKVNLLAELYGCTVRVDMGKHICYFDGPKDQCEALARKLCEVFKEEEVT